MARVRPHGLPDGRAGPRSCSPTSATSCATSAARAKAARMPPATKPSSHLLYPKGRTRIMATVIGSHADMSRPRASPTSATSTSSSTRPTTRPSRSPATSTPSEAQGVADQVLRPHPGRARRLSSVTVVTPPITSQRRATVTDTVRLAAASPSRGSRPPVYHARFRLRRRRPPCSRSDAAKASRVLQQALDLQNPGRAERAAATTAGNKLNGIGTVLHHRQARRQARRPRSHCSGPSSRSCRPKAPRLKR